MVWSVPSFDFVRCSREGDDSYHKNMSYHPPPNTTYVGPFQPAASRVSPSKIWSKAVRPGPANYSLEGSMGKQVNGLKTSNLPHAFGRETKEGFNLNPSLSQQFLFDHEQALGKQLTSRRPTQPRFHMGTSNRACTFFLCLSFWLTFHYYWRYQGGTWSLLCT